MPPREVESSTKTNVQREWHRLLCAKSCQSCPTLCNPMDYSLPGSSVHGILQEEYWSGLPCPPPGIFPTQWSNLCLLVFCTSRHPGSLPLAPPMLSVQSSRSVVSDSATSWIAARQASLCITNFWSSLRLNIHRVGDAIQPSHPLSSPSPPAPNPSQHQSLFQWINSSHEVAKVLEFQL